MTNEFAEADDVEGHGVIALARLDIVGRVMATVVTVVVGARVPNALSSTTRGFSVNLTLYCLLLD